MSDPAASNRPRAPRPGALSRRSFLRGAAGVAGVTALGGIPTIIAACGGPGGTPTAATHGSPVVGSELTLGSNQSDPVPRAAMRAVVEAFEQRTGVQVRVNTVDSSTFQDQIGSYLQGTPDDVFTWFAGERMRFFAAQGLAGDLSGVWSQFEERYPSGFRDVSTGTDGRQYLVPFLTYPWVVLYRRSVWEAQGYEVPSTLDDLVALWERMRSDGLIPVAFGTREGWPAMGTFDILDLRLNGYEFHTALLRGRERWTDPRVKRVFERWRDLLPYHQVGALGRTWQDAARTFIGGEAGTYFMATFAGEQGTEEDREDLGMFAFPAAGTEFDDERSIDAPVNGFMMRPEPRNPAAARAFLEFVATAEAQEIWLEVNPSRIAAAADVDQGGYTAYQRRMAEVIAAAGRIAQFFDRDTRPDFAGPNGMQAFLADFLEDPDQDLDRYVADVQAFWDSLT